MVPTLRNFGPQQLLYDVFWGNVFPARRPSIHGLNGVLTLTSQHTLPLLMLRADPDLIRVAEVKAASGADTAWIRARLASRALASRDYPGAAAHARMAFLKEPQRTDMAFLAVYALALSGDTESARTLLDSLAPGVVAETDVKFLAEAFGVTRGPSPQPRPSPPAGPPQGAPERPGGHQPRRGQ
jgi:hypothetical protein